MSIALKREGCMFLHDDWTTTNAGVMIIFQKSSDKCQITPNNVVLSATPTTQVRLGVYKQWNGLLDWNTGMDYQTGIFLVFTHF